MENKRNKLIANALDFISFLIENNQKIDRAILFGSVVSKEFDDESDIDIFIDTEDKEENINNLLREYEKSRGENWKFKGIANQISLKVGRLSKWPKLQRSIQSKGLLLYGDYNEIPEKIQNYEIFLLNFEKLKRVKKVSIWRKLYGYSQKLKNKIYNSQGLIKELDGKKLERGVVAIPSKNSKQLKDFLNKNKIRYKIIEVWSDSI